MYNPRFPHMVVVSSEVNKGTSWEPDIEIEDVLISSCRNYISTKGSDSSGVMTSQYTISLPRHNVNIKTGDKVTVTDRVRIIHGEVVASQVGNIGANIYYNEIKN